MVAAYGYAALVVITLSVLNWATCVVAGDWNQWRGSNRDGLAADSPPLMKSLPAEGLHPLWTTDEKIPGGGDGGWSSPVVAAGRVFLFAHFRTPGVKAQQPKFPVLSDDEKKKLSEEKLAEYEKNRLEEEQRLRREQPYDEVVYCFDQASGEELWRNQRRSVHTTFPHSGTPAILNGRLYVLCAGMKARCIDAETGSDVWETKVPGEFTYENIDSSFAIAGGLAVVLAEQLTALDVQTGEVRWQVEKTKCAGRQSSPAIWRIGHRELLVLNVGGGNTACIDPANGQELWRVKSEASASTPVISGDRLVTLGDSRKKGLRCFKMSPQGAEHQWTFQYAADPGSSPVVVGERVFVQGEQRLASVDLASGKPVWRTQIDAANPRYTSLVAADDKLFYVFDRLLMIDATSKKYQPLVEAKLGAQAEWLTEDKLEGINNLRQPLQCASPAIANGLLFVRLNDGLACYDLRQSGAMQEVAASETR